MSTLAAHPASQAGEEIQSTTRATLRRAQLALALGAVTTIPFTAVMLFARLTPDGDHFRYAADYAYTALGIPYMLAPLILLPAVHSVQQGRDGRLGRIGLGITSIGLVAFLALFPIGLIIARATSLGPTYILATLATFIGMTLFGIGSYRAGLLPRWIPPLWVVAWIVGGPLAIDGAPLLLAGVYVTIAVVLPGRVDRIDARR
jgi:hypothetical protein